MSAERPTWRVSKEASDGMTTVALRNRGGVQRVGESYAVKMGSEIEIGASDGGPGQAYIKEVYWNTLVGLDGKTAVVSRAAVRSTATHLNVDIELRVEMDNEPFFHPHWLETMPRALI
jgi:hypothetical protein